MRTSKNLGLLRAGISLLLGSFIAILPATAQESAKGTLQGRVINAQRADGLYLENARITLVELGRETFSDREGFYRFTEVPAGTVTVRTFFTGLDVQNDTVTVQPGGVINHDVSLNALVQVLDKNNSTLKLPAYTVKDGGEMMGSAIAINEQRFAANIKDVISTNEFGMSPSDDLGSIMRFLPGVAMEYVDGDARQVSVGGLSSDYVPVTVGGFAMSSAGQNTTTRNVSLNHASLNNLARVELVSSPTPESPGAALAGTVNLVPRSAFERRKPLFSFSTYLTARDDALELRQQIGPRSEKTHRVLPGADFQYVMPVTRNFGFTITGAASEEYKARDRILNTWRGANAATTGTGATTNFPDTTPDNPYLTDWALRDGVLFTERQSIAFTADWRVTPNDIISVSFSQTKRNSEYDNRALTFAVGRVAAGNFGPTFTHGAAGLGSLAIETESRNYDNTSLVPSVIYRHEGPIWRWDAGVGMSLSKAVTTGPSSEIASLTSLRRSGVTIDFDGIVRNGPSTVTVRDAGGAVIDPFDISTYTFTSMSASETITKDKRRSAFANISRNFDGPFLQMVKGGLNVSQAIRDLPNFINDLSTVNAFIGADGVGSTTPVTGDDSAVPYAWNEIAGRRGAFGFPAVPTVNIEKVLQLWHDKPQYFATETPVTIYNRLVTSSKYSEEVVSAGYIRSDFSFLDHRLKVIAGVRAEQTNVKGQGPLTDPSGNYQKDASGKIILDGAGKPIPIETDALAARKRTFVRRGALTENEYFNLFPSVNASYSFRDDLIARAAYYTSIGRPSFNQYAGGITAPDLSLPASNSNRFTVNNVDIKPWTAETFMLSLEYYFKRTGMLKISAFYRNYENFFGSITTPVTAEFLEFYHVDDGLYSGYSVATQYNIPDPVRSEGLTLTYKQALTFLPRWVGGISVFGTFTHQTLQGSPDARANFDLRPNFGSAGLTYSQRKLNLVLGYSFSDGVFSSAPTGRSIEAGTVLQQADRQTLDLTLEYELSKHFSIFAKVNDLTGDSDFTSEGFGPSTPEYATMRERVHYGALWTFGIRGKF